MIWMATASAAGFVLAGRLLEQDVAQRNGF